MCCVIGYSPPQSGDVETLKHAFYRLLDQARIRGTHAFGITTLDATTGLMFTRRSHDWQEIASEFNPNYPCVAHARYSTSGDWLNHRNNQPITSGQFSLAFNGVIDMGTKPEFEQRWEVECETDNDGEIFIRKVLDGVPPTRFVKEMKGSFAGVWLQHHADKIELWALRNERRPLWSSEHLGATWYTSTRDIFLRAGFDKLAEVEPLMEECVAWRP